MGGWCFNGLKRHVVGDACSSASSSRPLVARKVVSGRAPVSRDDTDAPSRPRDSWSPTFARSRLNTHFECTFHLRFYSAASGGGFRGTLINSAITGLRISRAPTFSSLNYFPSQKRRRSNNSVLYC